MMHRYHSRRSAGVGGAGHAPEMMIGLGSLGRGGAQ